MAAAWLRCAWRSRGQSSSLASAETSSATFDLAEVFGAAVRQDAQQADAVFGNEGDNPVIQQVGRHDCGFLGVAIAERHPRIPAGQIYL